MLFLFRSAPEVEKRIHSKLFRKFWRSRGTKEPAYITVKHPPPHGLHGRYADLAAGKKVRAPDETELSEKEMK